MSHSPTYNFSTVILGHGSTVHPAVWKTTHMIKEVHPYPNGERSGVAAHFWPKIQVLHSWLVQLLPCLIHSLRTVLNWCIPSSKSLHYMAQLDTLKLVFNCTVHLNIYL